jgi:hypothetical protein
MHECACWQAHRDGNNCMHGFLRTMLKIEKTLSECVKTFRMTQAFQMLLSICTKSLFCLKYSFVVHRDQNKLKKPYHGLRNFYDERI